MIFNIDFWYRETYLPTKRHRNLRSRYLKSNVDVDVKELTPEEFPVAFIIHDYKSVSETAKTYYDFEDYTEYRMFSEEIRTYNDKLYSPVRVTHGTAISLVFESLDYIKKSIEEYEPCWKYGEEFTEKSIVKQNNIEECKENIFVKASKYIVCDGVIWEECGEPRYEIVTFGLGHNHGGTGFFITEYYNPNIGWKNYFNALDREKAIAYGKQVATRRGDTKSVDSIGKYDFIEVLMPEMVKCDPQKDHGYGDEFMNQIEDMINGTDSAMEAGLLAMLMSVK